MTTPGAVWGSAFAPQTIRNSDATRHRLVMEEIGRAGRQGTVRPVTVINLHSFPLSVSLAYLGTIEVPARDTETGQPGRLEIRESKIDIGDSGDGNFIPRIVSPKELAAEFAREYCDIGGVFFYDGTGEPPHDELAKARDKQTAWFRSQYQQAVDSWSRYHQHKMITDRMREAARELFNKREIPKLPDWVTYMADARDTKECAFCGETIKYIAKVCRHCGKELPEVAMVKDPQ